MKSNISSVSNSLIVDTIWMDTIWFDLMYIRKREHKIDPCGATKKTKQNRISRCNSYTHFISIFSWSYWYIA